MEVSDLLPEAQSGIDELDDRGQPGDTDHQQNSTSQGHSHSDTTEPAADCEREFIPNCSNVPSSSSHDVGAVRSDVPPADANADGDLDIFMYLTLSATVLLMASTLYEHVMKK